MVLRLLLRHAPLGVHSAVYGHQPPRRTVLGQVVDGVQSCDMRMPCGLFQLSGGGGIVGVKNFLQPDALPDVSIPHPDLIN